jgi:hypothetical protein
MTPLFQRGLWLAALLVALGGAVPVAAQAQTGVIVGRVIDQVTEAPLGGANVVVAGSTIGAVSDSAGRFTIRGVPVGIATLIVRRIGYQPITRTDIAISPAKPAEVMVALRAVAFALSEVSVRPDAFPVTPPSATPVSTQTYTAEEVRRQPGAQEDVLRAVSVAPGVGVTSGARNDLIVRGGAPFENLFLVDNIAIGNINHFGSQGSTGGPLSIVNIRFIESASLSAGGYGARYGDRTASVTDITLREGNRERLAGELNIAASQYGAVLEGPLGENASFFANVRQSYLDLLFKALGQKFIPAYRDAIVKVSWRPTSRDAFSVLGLGASGTVTFDNDDADARLDNARILAPEQDQVVAGLTWKRLLDAGVVTTTVGQTWTTFSTAQRDSLLQPIFANRSSERETSLRSEATIRWDARRTLEFGVLATHASSLDYALTLAGPVRLDDAGAPQPLAVDTTFTATRVGAHAALTWEFTQRWRATLGARGDRYGALNDAVRVAPRASVSFAPDELSAVTLSGGRYWQQPSYIWLVGAASNASTLRPLRADHLVVGYTRRVRTDTKVQVELYGKRYADYPARAWRPNAVLQPSGFDDASTDIPFGLEPLVSAGRGDAIGAELFVQRRLTDSPWYGQAALSLNQTRFAGLDGAEAPGSFDTPVLANVVVGWRPNARWEVATRVRGASGLPSTPFVTNGAAAGTLDFTQYNQVRDDAYFAADLRVDRRFTLGRTQLIAFLDIQNVTGRANGRRATWDPRTRAVERSDGSGRLPTIGLNWEF